MKIITVLRNECSSMQNGKSGAWPGVREVAGLAKVSTDTVARLERGDELKERTVEAIKSALETAGVVFLAEDEMIGGGPGVRLKIGG